MRKGFLLTLLGLAALAAPVFGAVTIDFAGGGAGGTITCTNGGVVGACVSTSTVTGANILIGTMSVLGDGTHDGNYAITGGSLKYSFTGNPDTSIITNLEVDGTIGACTPISGDGTNCAPLNNSVTGAALLTGTSGDTFTWVFTTSGIAISANGPDTKNSTLLTALGLSGSLPFVMTGSSGGATGTIGVYNANTTDISNASTPEPTSILLLGTIVFGVATVIRRRNRLA
jgi:hypothetical protein